MKDFFSLESPFYRFMSRLWDMLKLNALWLVFSGVLAKFIIEYFLIVFGLTSVRFLSYLPMVFMGAATTAVYAVTIKMVDEHEGYIGRSFLRAFRENLRQGCLLGLIQMAAVYAIYIDFQLYAKAESYNMLFLIVGIIASVMTFMHTVYAFPLLARYENTLVQTMRNSYNIMLRFLPRTIFLVIVLALEFMVIFWNNTTIFLGILVGPGCIMLTVSGIGMYIFRLIEAENGIVSEDIAENDEDTQG